jgi:hypothetical protein
MTAVPVNQKGENPSGRRVVPIESATMGTAAARTETRLAGVLPRGDLSGPDFAVEPQW